MNFDIVSKVFDYLDVRFQRNLSITCKHYFKIWKKKTKDWRYTLIRCICSAYSEYLISIVPVFKQSRTHIVDTYDNLFEAHKECKKRILSYKHETYHNSSKTNIYKYGIVDEYKIQIRQCSHINFINYTIHYGSIKN